MNYEEMSDFEINQAVTCEVYGCHQLPVNESGDFYHCGSDGSAYYEAKVIDYCNNPSGAWPIIFDNEISLVVVDDDTWVARIGGIFSESDRPLRAAMIVFLMMQEAKRG